MTRITTLLRLSAAATLGTLLIGCTQTPMGATAPTTATGGFHTQTTTPQPQPEVINYGNINAIGADADGRAVTNYGNINAIRFGNDCNDTSSGAIRNFGNLNIFDLDFWHGWYHW